MKNLLFTNWHIMRWVRLAFSLFLFMQAYTTREWFFIAFASFFLFQVVFNLGCAATGCAVTNNKYSKK